VGVVLTNEEQQLIATFLALETDDVTVTAIKIIILKLLEVP